MDNKLYNSFIDVAIDERFVGYRTANLCFEEGMVDGKLLSLSYNASGFLMSTNPLPTPTWMELIKTDKRGMKMPVVAAPESFQLEVDGQALNSHWEQIGVEVTEEDGCKISKIRLKSKIRPIEAAVCMKLDGTSVFERWIEVTNLSDKSAAISDIAPLSGTLQIVKNFQDYLQGGDSLYELGYFRTNNWGHEGNFVWKDLPEEIYSITGRYRRDRHRHPMIVLRNKATGEMFICQIAWSGGYAFEFDNLQYSDGNDRTMVNNALTLQVKLDSPTPMFVMKPGETFISPSVHMGVVFGGLDEAINAMHEHVRKSVLIRPHPEDMLLIESGIGPEYVMSIENTKRAIDNAADIGAEIFFIDAGWYLKPNGEGEWWERVGDWNYDTDRYPNGLDEVREYANSKGIKFGLWLDAERIGDESGIFKEHPDWIAKLYTDERNAAGLIDLANPEVAAWMEQQIEHLINDYKIEFYRLDWNVGATQAVGVYENDGYFENTYVKHSKAVYDMYKRLRAKYPRIVFENCAGGGGRTDIGMVANFHHTWVTDWQIAPRSFGITNGMTMALPPECVDRLIGGQTGYKTADFEFQVRNLLFTHMTLGGFWPFEHTKPQPMVDFIKHNVKLYKEFIRPIISKGKVYHHTPVMDGSQPQGFGILEIADAGKGVVGIFQLSDPQVTETKIKLRGVSISKKYKVYFDNARESVEIDGFTLANDGLHVRLEGALTSELVTYEEI